MEYRNQESEIQWDTVTLWAAIEKNILLPTEAYTRYLSDRDRN